MITACIERGLNGNKCFKALVMVLTDFDKMKMHVITSRKKTLKELNSVYNFQPNREKMSLEKNQSKRD